MYNFAVYLYIHVYLLALKVYSTLEIDVVFIVIEAYRITIHRLYNTMSERSSGQAIRPMV